MKVFNGVEDLATAKGATIGSSAWHTVSQEQIDLFAEATGDRQWIHIDPAKAKDGPFGATIAHGYLTLSLIPALSKEVFEVSGLAMSVNYGVNRVRFTSPVLSGARVRATVELRDLAETKGGFQATLGYTMEIEGSDRPACVAETVALLVPGA
jgi:acyl dehydratase